MDLFNSQKRKGETSGILLILAVILLVAAVIVFLVIKMAEQPSAPTTSQEEQTIVQPIYEETLGEIKFVFESAVNYGATLSSKEIVNSRYVGDDANLITTERFIKVKIGAKNMGKINMEDGAWDIGEIVDSEGREFVALEGRDIYPWLPEDDLCGEVLKPAFNPTPCIKIYEVSRESQGLKIKVKTGKNNSSDVDDSDAMTALLDLIIIDN